MGWTIEDGEVVDAECDVCRDMDDHSVMAEAGGEVVSPVEPVPTDSDMNLRRAILDVLAANHESASDLRNDLYAIFQGVKPVPAPRDELDDEEDD